MQKTERKHTRTILVADDDVGFLESILRGLEKEAGFVRVYSPSEYEWRLNKEETQILLTGSATTALEHTHEFSSSLIAVFVDGSFAGQEHSAYNIVKELFRPEADPFLFYSVSVSDVLSNYCHKNFVLATRCPNLFPIKHIGKDCSLVVTEIRNLAQNFVATQSALPSSEPLCPKLAI